MPDIDALSTGILIENGCDPFTAVAGSIIEEPQPQARAARHPHLVRALGAIAGIIAAVALRSVLVEAPHGHTCMKTAVLAVIEPPGRQDAAQTRRTQSSGTTTKPEKLASYRGRPPKSD